MNILEASKRTGVSKDMIRFYEKKGLIEPSRNKQNNYRIYNEYDLNMIVMIHEYNSMGMSLKTISKLIREHSINDAASELEESIKKLKNEELWLHSRITNAVDMVELFKMVKNDISFEIGERPDLYCYPINDDSIINVHRYLAENGGVAKSVFRIKKANLHNNDWPEEHVLLLSLFFNELKNELEFIPCHKFYRTILSHKKGSKLGYNDIADIIKKMETMGYYPDGDVYIHQIMGSIENNTEDYLCIEFHMSSGDVL
ncbi:MAG: MerR family transcriptional regulator [Lachnospiraceae bacterium]|nr:MerR family transcriptional regulator [Lachnospiraceae bacterium]